MKTSLKHLRARHLDERTSPWRRLDAPSPPRRGWIRAVREGLGMSAAHLAFRLHVSRQAVADLERREVDGSVTLAALRRAADAMECELMYAVVPRRPVHEMLRDRARAIAADRLKGVAHSMHLEDQGTPPVEFERQVDDLANEILRDFPRDFWHDPPG